MANISGMDGAFVNSMRWKDLGELERWKLQEAIQSGGEIEPRLLQAAIDHLEEQRRAAKIFGIGSFVLTLLVALGVGGWLWVVDDDPTGAVVIGVLTTVVLSTTFVGMALYRVGQTGQQLEKLEGRLEGSEVRLPGSRAWNVGRALLSLFLAFTTWWFINLLIVTPVMSALGMKTLPESVGIGVGVTVVLVLVVGYYRLLAHRDYLSG